MSSVRFICPHCAYSSAIDEQQLPLVCCKKIYRQLSDLPTRPTLLRKARNFARDGLVHLARPQQVDDATRQWRREQCVACTQYFDAELQTCSHPQCGCGMSKKRGIIDALGWASKRCPIGRWDNPPPPRYTLADVSIVVTSFIRFDCLRRFLHSARFCYPGLPIIVADQSADQASGPDYEFCRGFPGVQWLSLPYDCGVSVCRNAAVASVQTPLVLLLDDDHVLSHESPLPALLDVLQSGELDLVCGVIRQANLPGHSANACHWHADFELRGQTLHAVPPRRAWQQSATGYWYRRVDRYINCFLARKDLLTRLPWNEVHKIAGEHLDHVLSLHHAGAKCGYTPNFVVGELKTDNPDYGRLRGRNSEHWARTRWRIDTKTGTWRTELEQGIARRMSGVPQAAAPNLVLLTVGNTGSTVVAGLLAALGWTIPDCDPEFNEPRGIRAANDALRAGAFDARLLPPLVRQLPRPWLIKDPRFCETLEAWLPALSETKPLLLWLDRDRGATAASWLRRQAPLDALDMRLAAAERHFIYWPWAKQRLSFEALAAWLDAFDPSRAKARGDRDPIS